MNAPTKKKDEEAAEEAREEAREAKRDEKAAEKAEHDAAKAAEKEEKEERAAEKKDEKDEKEAEKEAKERAKQGLPEPDSRALAKDYARRALPQAIDELGFLKALRPDLTDDERVKLQACLTTIITAAWLKGYSYALHKIQNDQAARIEAAAQIEAKAKAAVAPPIFGPPFPPALHTFAEDPHPKGATKHEPEPETKEAREVREAREARDAKEAKEAAREAQRR